jgi:hypothetical protein
MLRKAVDVNELIRIAVQSGSEDAEFEFSTHLPGQSKQCTVDRVDILVSLLNGQESIYSNDGSVEIIPTGDVDMNDAGIEERVESMTVRLPEWMIDGLKECDSDE